MCKIPCENGKEKYDTPRRNHYCLILINLDFTRYNPKLPLKLKFPGSKFCETSGNLMIVGKMPDTGKIIF